MKNTKLTKILILALSLLLMIGAAVGISASAEEETLTIVSQNVSYEGKTHLYYAVHYENVASPEDISLVVTYTDDEGELRTVTITESEKVVLKDSEDRDVVCRAFRTPGVDAKNFTKVFTVKAIIGETESAEKTYSVAEYCHQWLSYIASLAAPGEKELKIKAACESTLAYGSDIQALLDYYPNDNTADHPENYSYITVNGGTANGKNKLFVINGTEITLAANAGTPTTWEITDTDGAVTKITGNTFTADGTCYVSPINGKFFSDTTIAGSRYDYSDQSVANPTQDGSSYIKVERNDEALVFSRIPGTEGEGYLRWNTGTSENKFFVFESDVKFSGFTNATSVIKIRFQVGGIDEQVTINHSGNIITIVLANGTGKVTLNENEWYNLRFEIDIENRNFNVFVNNSYAGTLTSGVTTTTSSARVLFYLLKAGYGGVVEFDNLYHGFVESGTPIPEE